MWTVHGEPWQRWRFVKLPSGKELVMSEFCGLILTTENMPRDNSDVWLDSYRGFQQQQWAVSRSEDGYAFQIESAISAHALDAGKDPKIPASGENHNIESPSHPLIWSNWNGRCQEWTIARLP